MRYLQDSAGSDRGAVVRFADDIYVMSKSAEGVLELVEAMDVALAGRGGGGLAVPNEVSNLCLNFSKIRPKAIQEVVRKFLEASGWERCKVCKEPLPPKRQAASANGDARMVGRITRKGAGATC